MLAPPPWKSTLRLHFALGVAALAGCDAFEGARPAPEREPPPAVSVVPADPSARLARLLGAMRADAGALPPREPLAPPGDLRAEIAAFADLKRCEAEHAGADPLIADAISALGYVGLARDACRRLDAMKRKDAGACGAILSGALRDACVADVAIVVGDPTLCPRASRSARELGHEPSCVARATRDARLCAAAGPIDGRACRALVQDDASACEDDAACTRLVARWHGLVDRPAPQKEREAKLSLHVEASDAGGEPRVLELDLRELAEAGVVVSRVGHSWVVTLGAPRTAAWPSFSSPGATPRFFLQVSLPDERDAGALSLGAASAAFDLLLPAVGAVSSADLDAASTIDVAKVKPERGARVKLRLDALARTGTRTIHATADIATFVRDVLDTNAK